MLIIVGFCKLAKHKMTSIYKTQSKDYFMVNLILAFMITVVPFSSQATYFEKYDKDCDTNIQLDNSEYLINSEDLRLISGKLFLSYNNVLIPLKVVIHRELETFAIPEVVILVPCSECGNWYILGFDHNCNGVLK